MIKFLGCLLFHQKHWRKIGRKVRMAGITTYYNCPKCLEERSKYEIVNFY